MSPILFAPYSIQDDQSEWRVTFFCFRSYEKFTNHHLLFPNSNINRMDGEKWEVFFSKFVTKVEIENILWDLFKA